MRANRTEYLFSVNTHTPPTMTVNSGEEFTVEVAAPLTMSRISAVASRMPGQPVSKVSVVRFFRESLILRSW